MPRKSPNPEMVPEDPYLYTLLVSLKNAAGQVLEVVTSRVGFRTVELKNGRMLVNMSSSCLGREPPRRPSDLWRTVPWNSWNRTF